MNWAQLLVILLGILLVIFVAATIILFVQIIKLTRQIKITTKNAERTAHAIEDSVGVSRENVISVIIVRNILKRVLQQAQKRGKKPTDT